MSSSCRSGDSTPGVVYALPMNGAQQARRRLSSGEARLAILGAADAALRSGPYRDLTVDGLMERAGLSRTIFYRHFDDLPSVVVELLRDAAADLVDVTDQLRAGIDNPENLRVGLRASVDFFVANGPLVRAVVEGSGVDLKVDRALQGFRRHFTAAIDDGLRALDSAGRLAPIDIAATASALNGMGERYMIEALGRDPQEDPDRVLEVLWTIWARTLFGSPASA